MIRATFVRHAVSAGKKGKAGSMAMSSCSSHPPSIKRFSNIIYENHSSTRLLSTPLVTQFGKGPFVRSAATVKSDQSSYAVRSLSSNSSGQKQNTTSENGTDGKEGEEPSSQEIVLTPGEKVVVGTRLVMWAGIFAVASVCAYYIGKELIPTKMSPNTVFDKATNVVRQNEEVKRRFGDPFKTYGRDHGGHREGRRNFIEHTEYVSQDDGSKRTRVRFNLEGAYGQAFVFAEVSSDMPSGEFVYILVQDKRNGAVITVVDNRSALLAKKLAGESKEGMEILGNLLGGGKK